MKVITEEKLKELFYIIPTKTTNSTDIIARKIFSNLIENELKEIDTLTVSKLRSMSEAPDSR